MRSQPSQIKHIVPNLVWTLEESMAVRASRASSGKGFKFAVPVSSGKPPDAAISSISCKSSA